MKNRTLTKMIPIALPFILGITSFFMFALYFYSANHAPYTYINVIFSGPVLSFIGVIIILWMIVVAAALNGTWL